MKVTKKEFMGMLYYYKSALPNRSPDFENNKEAIKFWWDKFSGFSKQDLFSAFEECVISQDYWPTPRQFLSYLGESEISIEEKGRQISSTIIAAIRKFGRVDQEGAKKYIGDVGWRVVMMQGGWERVCETLEKEIPILQAQWRDLSISILKQSKISNRVTERIERELQIEKIK